MIPRKKKKVIIIVSIIILLIIMTISLILLYINTDLFRSNATLFAKYFGQNVENIDTIYQKMGESELNQIIKQNKYTTKTQVKMNYIEGRGTTSENTQNSINQLKLNIEGQTDKNNQYNYQDIHLVKNDKKLAEVEYLQDGNTHGIRFSDLFSQYVVADNENLKNLLKKINDDEESLKNIPDRIEFGEDLKKSFQLSLEEKQNLRTNYVNLINLNVTKDKFSKQANQTIQINGKSINVNAYSVTLTKEQMNNLIIKMLEQIKQDEIILTRIDKIQMLLLNNQTKNLKEEFITNINNRITSITRNNIGQEEAKIIVYENNQKTIKTVIENEEYEISIDVLPQQEQNYLQISYRDSEIEQAITYNDTKTEQNINLKNIEGKKTVEYSLSIQEEMNNNNGTKNIIAKYEDSSNRIETTIKQEIDIVNKFDKEIRINNDNFINLSTLEKEQLQSILQQINNKVSEKIETITMTDINKEDWWKVLITLGLVKKEQNFENIGITETQKNRFNSKFEILQGENLGNQEILALIEAVKENLVDIEIVSNTELKLKVQQAKTNKEVDTNLISFIEKNKDKKYNVKVEYEEETGLVKEIIIAMVQNIR